MVISVRKIIFGVECWKQERNRPMKRLKAGLTCSALVKVDCALMFKATCTDAKRQ